MPAALELVSGHTTAPGATITALTMDAPGSAAIRYASLQSDIRLLSAWGYHQGAGIFRMRSPKMHDAINGLRMQVLATQANPLLPMRPLERLYPQDTLTLENTGSATSGKIEIDQFLVWYQDLPGSQARFIDTVELARRTVHIAGVEVDCNPGSAGGWSGVRALNFSNDQFKALTDYALIGYHTSVPCAGIAVVGPDTSNYYVGGPGSMAEFPLTQEWFIRLSRENQIPLIPVINGSNKAGTNLYVAQNDSGTAVNVTLLLAELAPGGSTSATARPGG